MQNGRLYQLLIIGWCLTLKLSKYLIINKQLHKYYRDKILNEEAEELKNLCPMGVFDIEDLGKKKSNLVLLTYIEGAIVGDSRKCTTCRECIRSDKFRDKIDLGKLKDTFEFHVESVGTYHPKDIVIEAFKILKEKA